MTRITRRETIPARPAYETTQTVGTVCDLCGRMTKKVSYGYGTDWSEQRGHEDSIQISRHVGERPMWQEDPDGRVRHTFDVCPSCWDDKLVPFFAIYGGTTPQIEELD